MTSTNDSSQRADICRDPDPSYADRNWPLWGRSLRFVLVDLLMANDRVTVAQMVTVVDELGFVLNGRASKVISDALRWEIRRGRVIRIARGVYQYRSAPASTARRIRILANHCRSWITAVSKGLTPPPTPPDTRAPFGVDYADPRDPPWNTLRWLWAT